jgi:hypothetical protein
LGDISLDEMPHPMAKSNQASFLPASLQRESG